ncbi:MAG: DUF1080 domain-containing protein [Planctomycetaceae bacterium]|nr:DUF1080 domain-containing protein [Planctomycetaceae bacterium]
MKTTMHRRELLACAAATAAWGVVAQARAEEKEPITLFNGRDLEGWTGVLADENVKAADVWSVLDGVLVCKGKPSGYLKTEREDFHDYMLSLEWRFPAGSKGGNSGVLVHATTPRTLGIWPKSMEAQLNHGHAGDIWVIGTTCKIDNAAERVKDRRHFNLTDDSEKPIGEWNKYEIHCSADNLTIMVNGVLVNHVSACSVTKGAIALQSEGAEIHFRNIRLWPLK